MCGWKVDYFPCFSFLLMCTKYIFYQYIISLLELCLRRDICKLLAGILDRVRRTFIVRVSRQIFLSAKLPSLCHTFGCHGCLFENSIMRELSGISWRKDKPLTAILSMASTHSGLQTQARRRPGRGKQYCLPYFRMNSRPYFAVGPAAYGMPQKPWRTHSPLAVQIL